MKHTKPVLLWAAVGLAAGAAVTMTPARPAHAAGDAKGVISLKLKLDPTALQMGGKYRIGYFPIQLPLTADKPVGITKEPKYQTTPKYAVLHLGNGPNSAYTIAVDEPEKGDFKVYVDVKHNGDLTAGGDGAWIKKTEGNGRTMYGVNTYTLRASWGDAKKESAFGDYGISLYRIAGINALLAFRNGARVGEVTLDGKTHKALLAENDMDAIYNKPVPTDDKGAPVDAPKTRPVWLFIDMTDSGSFAAKMDETMFDVRAPFKLGEKTYEATVAADGSTIKLMPTTKVAAQLTPKPKPRPALLTAGTDVPDFKAEAKEGGTVQPADYKGKILILDFWATWCGPCQKSMPHLERVYKAVKDKNVAVLAVCVWDDKDAYEKWIPKHKDDYSFPLAFDPAGKNNANSIAMKLFNVSGIPTTYIIDGKGKVAAAIVGYDDGDTRLEAELKKLGVDVPEAAATAK